MTYPKIYHIGVSKTGTTTIQNILKNDNRVNLIFAKQYFNSNRYYIFPAYPYFEAGKINIESDETICKSNNGTNSLPVFLERLKRHVPDAVILITIREQISVLKSAYKHSITHYKETNPFTEWLVSEKSRGYFDMVMYATIFKTVNNFFSKESIKFLLYEDMKSDYQNFITNLYSIINLKPPETIVYVEQNKSLNEQDLYDLLLENIKVSNSENTSRQPGYDSFLDWTWDKSYWRKLLMEIQLNNQELINITNLDKNLFLKYNYIF